LFTHTISLTNEHRVGDPLELDSVNTHTIRVNELRELPFAGVDSYSESKPHDYCNWLTRRYSQPNDLVCVHIYAVSDSVPKCHC
jgi:hypothetical protein